MQCTRAIVMLVVFLLNGAIANAESNKFDKASHVMQLAGLHDSLTRFVMTSRQQQIMQISAQIDSFEQALPRELTQTAAFRQYQRTVKAAMAKYEKDTNNRLSEQDYLTPYIRLYSRAMRDDDLDKTLAFMQSDAGRREISANQHATTRWLTITLPNIVASLAPERQQLEHAITKALVALQAKTASTLQPDRVTKPEQTKSAH